MGRPVSGLADETRKSASHAETGTRSPCASGLPARLTREHAGVARARARLILMRRCTRLYAHRSAAARYCASPLRFLPPSPLDDSLLPSLPPAHLNVHRAVAGRQAARGAACGRSDTPLAHPSPARPPPIPTHTGAGARPPPPPPEAGPRREGERATELPAALHIKMQLYLDPIKTYPIYAMIEIAKFDWRESYHSTQTATRSSGIFSVVGGDGAVRGGGVRHTARGSAAS